MNCPECGDDRFYKGFTEVECVNPHCSIPGKKVLYIYIGPNGEKYIDSKKYLGFQEWVNPPKKYFHTRFLLYKEGVVLTPVGNEWYSYLKIDENWTFIYANQELNEAWQYAKNWADARQLSP